MRFELSQEFYFDAAHTLHRDIDAVSSKRIHGHTYRAEVSVGGQPHSRSGMIMDLEKLKQAINHVRDQLDHHLLDEVPDLGVPTLENLCQFIARRMADTGISITKVLVWREASGAKCSLVIDRF